MLDRRKGNSPIEDIFGPGGVRITTNGSIELSSGIVSNRIDNPTLPERSRKRNRLDLDPKIQLDVNARVGTKINFGLSYDTEGVFDFDSRQIKLAYQGDEDEIIRNIEAGNVSMSSRNSLINGGTSLFGIKSTCSSASCVSAPSCRNEISPARQLAQGNPDHSIRVNCNQYDENHHFLLDTISGELRQGAGKVAIYRVAGCDHGSRFDNQQAGNYDQVRNVGFCRPGGAERHP